MCRSFTVCGERSYEDSLFHIDARVLLFFLITAFMLILTVLFLTFICHFAIADEVYIYIYICFTLALTHVQ